MSNPRHDGDATEKELSEKEREEERRTAERESTATKTDETAEVVVDWDGPEDPQNPKK